MAVEIKRKYAEYILWNEINFNSISKIPDNVGRVYSLYVDAAIFAAQLQ